MTQEIIVLKKKLPRKYAEKIKQTLGYSESMVYKTMKGERSNPEIIQALKTMAEEHERKTKQKLEKIKELV